MVEPIPSVKQIDFEVIDVIIGAFLETQDEIQLGPFRIERLPRLIKRLTTEYEDLWRDNILPASDEAQLAISVKVRARDPSEAVELGKLEFTKFENFLAYIIDQDHSQVDVGHSKVPGHGVTQAISHESLQIAFGGQGYLDVNLEDPLFASTQNLWIWNAAADSNPNEWTRRIMRTIDWMGRSQRDVDPVRKFVQLVFAIESLLTYQEENILVSPSIAATLSEGFAFLLGEDRDQRLSIYRDINDIYKKRSALVHGGKKTISTEDISNASELLHKVLLRITTKQPFVDFTAIKGVVEWIKTQKFTTF